MQCTNIRHVSVYSRHTCLKESDRTPYFKGYKKRRSLLLCTIQSAIIVRCIEQFAILIGHFLVHFCL